MLPKKLKIMQTFAKNIRRALLAGIIILAAGTAAIAQNDNTAPATTGEQKAAITIR